MNGTARMLANALLEHHREVCVPRLGTVANPSDCVITYGDLCRAARTQGLERSIGQFLQQIAEWCAQEKHPPINSLAVNSETRRPGDSYSLAPGCSNEDWDSQVAACIIYEGYR